MPGPAPKSPEEKRLSRRIGSHHEPQGLEVKLPALRSQPPSGFSLPERREWDRVVELLADVLTEGDRAFLVSYVRLSVKADEKGLLPHELSQLRNLAKELGLVPRHERTPRRSDEADVWSQF